MNPLEMIYSPSVVFSPKDVYEQSLLSDLSSRIKGYRIVDFRPVRDDDIYLNIHSAVTRGAMWYPGSNYPRFILKRERTDTERIDGITKLYFANSDLGSREAIDAMMDREEL